MGLHGGCGDIEFLDAGGAEVEDLADVLEGAFHQQEFGIGDQAPVALEKVRVDDGVADAGFIFKGQKDEAVGGAGPLPCDNLAGDAEPGALR